MLGCYNNRGFEWYHVGESLSWQQSIACQVPQQSYPSLLWSQGIRLKGYGRSGGISAWFSHLMVAVGCADVNSTRWGRNETPLAEYLEWLKRTPGHPHSVWNMNSSSGVAGWAQLASSDAPALSRSLQERLHCLSLASLGFCTGFQQPWCRVLNFPSLFLSNGSLLEA